MLCVVNCIRDCVWLTIPQATEWQRIGDEIKAAVVFTRADFVNVLNCRQFQDSYGGSNDNGAKYLRTKD